MGHVLPMCETLPLFTSDLGLKSQAIPKEFKTLHNLAAYYSSYTTSLPSLSASATLGFLLLKSFPLGSFCTCCSLHLEWHPPANTN